MAIYSKAQLYKAIKAHCSECNDVHGAWTVVNDCTGKNCPLYGVRPGDGPGHLEKMKTHQKSSPAAIAALKVAQKARSSRHRVVGKASNPAK